MNVGISFVLLSIVNTSEFILKASDHYTARNTRATELLFRRQVLSHGGRRTVTIEQQLIAYSINTMAHGPGTGAPERHHVRPGILLNRSDLYKPL